MQHQDQGKFIRNTALGVTRNQVMMLRVWVVVWGLVLFEKILFTCTLLSGVNSNYFVYLRLCSCGSGHELACHV